MAPTRRLAELFYELRARTEGLDKDLAQSQRSFGKLTSFVLANPVAAVTAIGTAMLAVAVKASRMAADVERGLQRVSVTTTGGAAGVKQLRTEIEQLSSATGRTQAELAQAAALAAKSAGSTAEVGERLKAAVALSSATGEDLTGIVENLDTVLDVFNKTSAESTQAVAELFAAAKGNQPIMELFAGIEAAAPGIRRMGLDLGTTARALVALGEDLGNPKQAAAELKKLTELGEDGRKTILALAASVPVANDALGQLAKAADDANNSAEALNNRLKADLDKTLIDLGNRIRPLINAELKGLVGLLDLLTGRVGEIKGQSNLSTVISLGPIIEKLESQGKNGAKGVRELVAEVTKLSAAVRGGDVKLPDLDVGQLRALKSALESIAGSDRVAGSVKRGEIQELLTAIDAVIAKAPEAAAAVATVVNPPSSGRKSRTAEEIEAAQKAAKEAAKDAAASEEIRVDAVNKALDEIVAKRKNANEEIRKLDLDAARDLAVGMGHAVRALDIQIKAEVERLKKLGASDAEIRRIVAPLEAARKAALGLNGALEKIEFTPEQRTKVLAPLQRINLELDELRKKMEKAGASTKEIDRALKEAGVAKLAAAFRDLGFATEDAQKKAEAYFGRLTSIKDVALDVAQSITDIGTALLGVASGLGIIDARTQSIAQGALNIGAGATRIGGGDVLGGGLQLLGGLGSLLGAFKSQPDPEAEAARQKALESERELTEALDRVRDRIGDLIQFSTSGADIAAVTRVPLTIRQRTGGISGLEEIDFFRNIEDVLADLRKVGVSLEDLRKIAGDAGVTLSQSPTIAELERLQKVLLELDFAAFTNTFAGQLSRLERQFDLFGDSFDEPAEKFAAFVALLNDPKVGAPGLFGALDGLETGTSEGRDAIRALIQGLFTKAVAGELTPEQLGGLSLKEFLDALALLNDQLKAAGERSGDAAEAAKTIAEQIAELFADVDRTLALQDTDDPFEVFKARASTFATAFPQLASFFDQFDLTSIEGVKAFGAALPGLIAGLEDGSIVLDGISADDLPALIAALLGLESAGDAAENAVLSLAQTLANAFSDIDLDAAIFGEGLADTINKKLGAVGLGSFDLSSQSGRDAARQALRDLATTDPSLKPLIANLIGALDNLPDLPGEVADAIGEALGGGSERSSIASAATALTERTGNRMADYLATGLILDRRKIELLEQIVAGSSVTRGILVQPPSLSMIGASLPSVTSVQGGISIQFNDGAIQVSVPAGTPEALVATRIGDATLQELGRRLSRFFAAEAIDKNRGNGNVGIS